MPNDPMIAELLDDLASQAATARLSPDPAAHALADDLDALVAAHRAGRRVGRGTAPGPVPASLSDARRQSDSVAADDVLTDGDPGEAEEILASLVEHLGVGLPEEILTAARDEAVPGGAQRGRDDSDGEEGPGPLSLVVMVSADGPLGEAEVTEVLAELAPTFDDAFAGVTYGEPTRVGERAFEIPAVATSGVGVPGTVAFSGTVRSGINVVAVVPTEERLRLERDADGNLAPTRINQIAELVEGITGGGALDEAGTARLVNELAGEELAELGVTAEQLCLVIRYRRLDGERLDGADLDLVATRGMQSLSRFGNLIETGRTVDEDGATLVYEALEPGELSLASVATALAAWQGTLPFPGVGLVSASAEVGGV